MKESDVDVSVVVINYNTYDLTCSCLKSIIEKTSGIKYEIILVDNNSNEKDPAEFISEFSEVLLIKSSENLGFAKGNNLGIEHAKGEYVLLLNSDTELKNNAIYLAYRRIKEDDTIGVLSGKLFFPNGKLQAVSQPFPSIKRELFDLFRLSKFLSLEQRSKHYMGTEADYTKEFETDWVWGTFFMFKRLDLNYFPQKKLQDDFFMYYEDVQWCYHFKKVLGKKILYSPKPEVYHYIGGSDKNTSLHERHLNKMLPNQHLWMKKVKGVLYTKMFFLIKAIHHYSLRTTIEKRKALIYFQYLKK